MRTQEYPIFTAGDTFNIPVWLRDTNPELTIADDDPARGFDLSSGTITAKVGNQTIGFTTNLVVVPFADQTTNKGWVYVRSSASTASWPLGLMKLELKLSVTGSVKTAQHFMFNVTKGV